MPTKTEEKPADSVQSKSANWLFNQVAPTVLLFVIVVGGGYSALWQLPGLFKDGIQELRASNKEIHDLSKAAYEADQARDDAARQRLERLVDDAFRGRPIVNHKQPVANTPL